MTTRAVMNMVKGMRHAVPALLLTCLSATAVAQPQAALQPGPGLEAPEEEVETFGVDIPLDDPSGQAMRSFHEALRRVEEGGQARVMFYGASHVAADFFTNVVRSRLQARFGDAGHGFLMPVRPWRSYRHLGGPTVESSRAWTALRVRANTREIDHLGVAGMAVDADSANAWGRLDTGTATASRFVVHYLLQPDGGSFDIRIDGSRYARVPTAGAAIGAGTFPINGLEDAHHTLEVRARGDGPIRIFGVSVERERAGVIVDTMGLNGARAVSQLRWDESLHQPYLRGMDPSLVVLAYGTNESGDDGHPIEAYEMELWRVLGRIRGTVPNASCLLIGPSDRPMRVDGEPVDRPRTHQVIEVQRRVSRAFGCAFFDLVEFGGGPLSMVRWSESEPRYAQRDLVHFTGRAYVRLGEVLHAAMMAGFDASEGSEPSADERSGSR